MASYKVMLLGMLPYSTKHLMAKSFADFTVFAWTVNIFPQILKCFGTCGHCFDANMTLFNEYLHGDPTAKVLSFGSFVLYSILWVWFTTYDSNKAFMLSHMYTFCTFNILLVCESIISCPRGSQCEVDETVHQAYCEPSCDLDNGGCADNEVCSLQQQQQNCTSGLCPPVVQCFSE